MLNIEYRRVEATNNHAPILDMDLGRVKGLARRYCAQTGETDVNFWERTFCNMITEATRAVGICGGMVCERAWQYLITDDPLFVPGTNDSALRQGHAKMTLFKRGIMGKDHAISVSKTKMYDSLGLTTTKVIRTTIMPATLERYIDVTQQIAAALNNGVPYVLGVSPVGGKHAIGLTLLNGMYYVLEPNQGLFRYAAQRTSTLQLANHFKGFLPVGSEWKLKSISLQQYS